MNELDAERAVLAKAERDIREGEQRVAAQAALIEQLRERDQPTDTAEALQATLRETLESWRVHRREILRRIDHLCAVRDSAPTKSR